MPPEVEYARPVEVRASGGGVLVGEALPYGERARDRPEMFSPSAFVSGLDTAALNLQHDRERLIAEQPGALTFTDTPQSLRLKAELRPDSAEARLVRRGALRGLSVEFVALSERRERGVRVITEAHLDGVALVDLGSYRTEVEVREWEEAWLTATIPTESELECLCQGGDCTDVEFGDGAFEDLGASGDILAVGGGGFANVLGSARRGTLITRNTRRGLQVGLTEPNTETARRVVESARVAPIYARPILDLERSEFADEGTLRRFSRASVRAILIKPTDSARGHIPAEIEGVTEGRRRLWL